MAVNQVCVCHTHDENREAHGSVCGLEALRAEVADRRSATKERIVRVSLHVREPIEKTRKLGV